MLYNFMYYTPSQLLYNQPAGFQLLANRVESGVENSVDHDQLASEKPADHDLHCFQNGIYPGLAWYGLNTLNITCQLIS